MADADLDAIRQRRLAQLSGENGSPANASSGGQDQEAAAQQAAEEDENRRAVMSQILDSQARERLARIALVRPERERSLQELLVRMARSGQLRGRVTDEQLLSLLDQVAASESARTGASVKNKITISRRRDKTASDGEEEDEEEPHPKPTSSTKHSFGDDNDDDIFDL